MGLAVTVACGSVRLARWCFLGASSVVLVAQMARMRVVNVTMRVVNSR